MLNIINPLVHTISEIKSAFVGVRKILNVAFLAFC